MTDLQPSSGMLKVCAIKDLDTAMGRFRLDLAFNLQEGSRLGISGPSGSGKTTLLRLLAGLVSMDAGFVSLNGDTWCDTKRKIDLRARKRPIGMVFQDLGLFPHLSVRQQLNFALSKGDDTDLVDELIEMMELGPLQDRRPAQLSGGQQQRLALARAIARRPRLLLLDEPLSALDDEMRSRLQDHLLKIHRRFGLTMILVSHHLPEILRLSDEVLVLDAGKIIRRGPPANIFSGPRVSSKFRVRGLIVSITPADIVFVVEVQCTDGTVSVIATAEEAAGMHIGQQVMVASKAFNPVILPL